LTCLALLVAGCPEKNAPSATDAAAAASAAANAAATSPPATADNDPLPSHSEAARKVRGEVTKANYKTELDKIEKEIE
jgi:hypothetical protein